MSQSIHFIDCVDTTFRDGQQSPLLFDSQVYHFGLETKKTLLKGLLLLGIRHIELFAPIVSAAEHKDSLALMKYGRALSPTPVSFMAHCRLHPDDMEGAVQAGFDGLHVYVGTSPQAQAHSHHMDMPTIIAKASHILQEFRNKYPHLYLRISAEDAFRSDLADVLTLYDAVTPYVQTVGAPDTVGVATPDRVREVIGTLRKRYPNTHIECHFHNDRGLAVYNSVVAVEAGANLVDTSIWGLAERSGIPSTTAFLFNLTHEYPEVLSRYTISEAYPLNVLMGDILKTHVPYTEPISLTNRTHTAGVHQKAVLNNSAVYEAHHLERWGVQKNQLLLGPLSGWNLVHYFLKEIGGYEVSEGQAKQIARLFKDSAESVTITNNPEKHLFAIADQFGLTKHTLPRKYQKRRIENLDTQAVTS